MKRIGVLLSGRGSNFEAIARSIAEGRLDAEIGVVISNRPEARGLERARELDLNAVCLPSKGIEREAFDRILHQEISKHNVDLICLAGYMRLLSGWFTRQYPNCILNIHPSLLPAFAGLDAQHQALVHGVKFTGCTVHFVDEATDGGPILVQAAVPVLPGDTEATLADRIHLEEHRIYPMAVRWIASRLVATEGRRTIVEAKPAVSGLSLFNPGS